MKTGLFIISFIGFALSAYFLVQDFAPNFDDVNHVIYLSLLFVLLINSIVGIWMVLPENLKIRKKIRVMNKDVINNRG